MQTPPHPHELALITDQPPKRPEQEGQANDRSTIVVPNVDCSGRIPCTRRDINLCIDPTWLAEQDLQDGVTVPTSQILEGALSYALGTNLHCTDYCTNHIQVKQHSFTVNTKPWLTYPAQESQLC